MAGARPPAYSRGWKCFYVGEPYHTSARLEVFYVFLNRPILLLAS